MGRVVLRALLPGVLLASAGFPAFAAPGLESVEEIRACTRANYPERTSIQEVVLTATDRAGGQRSLEARLHWKRKEGRAARIMIRVEAPPDLRGSAYLVIENRGRDDMFMYLPAMQKVRRISAGAVAGELWGTDFSYEDIKQLQGIAFEGETQRLPDERVAERAVYVLEMKPHAEEESAYARIVSYIDQESCVPLRIDFFERDGEARKRLEAIPDQVRPVDGRWVAHDLAMQDLRNATHTRLEIKKVVNDGKIPDRAFDPGRFYLGR